MSAELKIKDSVNDPELIRYLGKYSRVTIVEYTSDDGRFGAFPSLEESLRDYVHNGTRYKSREPTDLELAAMGLSRLAPKESKA